VITFASQSALITLEGASFRVIVSMAGRSIAVDAARITAVATRDPVSRLPGLTVMLTDPAEQITIAAATRFERRQLRILGAAIEATANEARLTAALDRTESATAGNAATRTIPEIELGRGHDDGGQ
jgi:hypothetical protein